MGQRGQEAASPTSHPAVCPGNVLPFDTVLNAAHPEGRGPTVIDHDVQLPAAAAFWSERLEPEGGRHWHGRDQHSARVMVTLMRAG